MNEPSARKISIPDDSRRRKLLGLLSDGNFYSGEVLARQLKVTRSAVWKLIKKLRALGVEIEAQARKGYRLPHPVDLYDKQQITATLTPATLATIQQFHSLLTIDSTNRYLADEPAPDPGKATVCVAELQVAGRGRRGRTWLAPFGSGICLSLSWQFAEAPPTFSALGLAVGVAAMRAMRRFGQTPAQLKWPNDLVVGTKKLGGMLIEMRGESAGPARVIIGIGINTRLPASTRLALAEERAALVTDVHELLQDRTPTRNVLVAALLEELVVILRQFEREGFAAFEAEWRSYDSLANAPVQVLTATATIQGIARGVAPDGALLVDVNGQVQRYMSGDVSLRPAAR